MYTVPALRKEKTRKKKKDFQQKLVRKQRKMSPQKLGVRKKKKVPWGQKLGVRKKKVISFLFLIENQSFGTLARTPDPGSDKKLQFLIKI